MLNNLLYLDPAATTAIVTSLTGIVAAVAAAFIIRWRKIKKGVSKTLHIDENANKEVEDDLVITDAETLQSFDSTANYNEGEKNE